VKHQVRYGICLRFLAVKQGVIINSVKTQDIHLPPKSPNSDAGGEIHICLHAWGAEGAEGAEEAEGEQSYRWCCQLNWTIYYQVLSSPAVSILGDLELFLPCFENRI